jgi:hypothetical protein
MIDQLRTAAAYAFEVLAAERGVARESKFAPGLAAERRLETAQAVVTQLQELKVPERGKRRDA